MKWSILLSLTRCVPVTRLGRVIRCLRLSWFWGPLAHGVVLQLVVFSPFAFVYCVPGISSDRSSSAPLGSCVVSPPCAILVRQSGGSQCPQLRYVKSPDVMHLLRLLTLEACRHNFVFSAAHSPGRDNSAADALSRLRLQEFRRLAPHADHVPRQIPPSLLSLLVPPA